jgi:hypothetical protein
MQPRRFHITEFPEKLSILLEDKFRKDFINSCLEATGSRVKLARSLGIKKLDTINRWKNGFCRRGRGWITPQLIPLSKLLALQRLVADEFTIVDIEKHVVKYKASGPGNSVKNPNLPLQEDERLIKILVHLIGDGYGSNRGTQFYRNTNSELRRQFITDLKVFGDVEYAEKGTFVFFPICITNILKKIYKINFSTKKARLPKVLWELPKNFASAALRAFVDDESHIRSRVTLYSSNRELLEDIRSLINHHFPRIAVSRIEQRNRPKTVEFSFCVYPNSLDLFAEKIGFDHSEKRNDLEFYLTKQKRGWNNRGANKTKILILKSLLEGEKTSKVISKELLVDPRTVTYHIRGYNKRGKRVRGLEELELVKNVNNKRNYFIWKITKKGIRYLEGEIDERKTQENR